MKPTVTRRSFFLGSASMAALATGLPGFAFAQDSVTADQFIALSARLTETPASSLDTTTAGKLLEAFLANGRGPGLALLATDTQVDTGTVANDVVAAWYSGVVDTQDGQALAGFTDALMWNALDFTKPFAYCGGEMGYWADPPQN
ncbi:sugar dehydrogenase complex small subunit [Mesorhizobium sp. IMUNJ 23232]|uniref:sugar dehydrogenase complex small subunit n=1 Tax=Mesorhizobium sp. IMUNJ 23232 TaxID=3376064 RepID=UPI0037969DCB